MDDNFPKTCSACGRVHSREAWIRLKCLGVEMGLEWRDCDCGSTLTIIVDREAFENPEVA